MKSSVATLDFYDTYDSRKFCDWIVHLDILICMNFLTRVEFDLLKV